MPEIITDAEWQKLYFAELIIKCRAIDEIKLPQYSGATIRGALGSALYKDNCIFHKTDCSECEINISCPYYYFFEAQRAEDGGFDTSPFSVIPSNSKTIKPGDVFEFAIVLYGKSIDYAANIISALNTMGILGVGKGKATFAIENISQKGQLVYREGRILRELQKQTIEEYETGDKIRLNLITPLRLKKKGRYIYVPEFSDIVKAILRRYTILIENFCDDKFNIDFDALISRSQAINISRDATQWLEFDRYSRRQAQKVPMHGTIGEVEYTGNFKGLEYIMAAIDSVNIGSSTGFGFGRIRVSRLLVR
ncbi:MAG: CRISPR system precrRNA processing endoribonuclease RAMP protein Cas6 [Candidatus Zixiibacteriota bacterium]